MTENVIKQLEKVMPNKVAGKKAGDKLSFTPKK